MGPRRPLLMAAAEGLAVRAARARAGARAGRAAVPKSAVARRRRTLGRRGATQQRGEAACGPMDATSAGRMARRLQRAARRRPSVRVDLGSAHRNHPDGFGVERQCLLLHCLQTAASAMRFAKSQSSKHTLLTALRAAYMPHLRDRRTPASIVYRSQPLAAAHQPRLCLCPRRGRVPGPVQSRCLARRRWGRALRRRCVEWRTEGRRVAAQRRKRHRPLRGRRGEARRPRRR